VQDRRRRKKEYVIICLICFGGRGYKDKEDFWKYEGASPCTPLMLGLIHIFFVKFKVNFGDTAT